MLKKLTEIEVTKKVEEVPNWTYQNNAIHANLKFNNFNLKGIHTTNSDTSSFLILLTRRKQQTSYNKKKTYSTKHN